MIAEVGQAAMWLAAALAIALVLLLAVRALGWRRRRIGTLVRPWLLAIWILLTLSLSSIAADGIEQQHSPMLGCWAAASLLVHLVDRRRTAPRHASRRWGAHVAHAGIAVALGGIILSSAFTASIDRVMAPGDTVKFRAWTLQLHQVWPAAGPGWAGIEAELRATRGAGVILIEPQLQSQADGSTRSGPATLRSASGTMTARIGAQAGDGGWPVRLSWAPLPVLVPIGGLVAALGGALAMVGPAIARRRRLRRARLADAWWA